MTEPIAFTNPNPDGAPITCETLSGLESEEQIEVMRTWFYERYMDPVHGMPWDSEDKVYVYITGGPYSAGEELYGMFEDVVPDELIDELVDELEVECLDWAGVYVGSDIYQADAALENPTPLKGLNNNLSQLELLLEQKDLTDPSLHEFQRMMIFSFAITSLETYLFEAFIQKVMLDPSLKAKYMAENFKGAKIDIADIPAKIDNVIKTKIASTTFHDLVKVGKLFSSILNISLPNNQLEASIIKRHDFVHRCGKDADGNVIVSTKEEVTNLIRDVSAFCCEIKEKITPNEDDDLAVNF